jgi:RimJ/RimL family protein N-acetyltransferase
VGLLGTGYATISTDVDAYIGGVACSVRGQGVGFSIVNGLVNWLGQKNITLIEMTIAVHNREMQGLATKIGFTKESEFTEDRFYKTGYFGNWFLRL